MAIFRVTVFLLRVTGAHSLNLEKSFPQTLEKWFCVHQDRFVRLVTNWPARASTFQCSAAMPFVVVGGNRALNRLIEISDYPGRLFTSTLFE
jgi:hypothetical protein